MVKAIHERVPALDKLCFTANCDFPIVSKVLGSDAVLKFLLRVLIDS